MTWVYHATPEINEASHYPAIIAVSVTFCALMLIVVTTRGVYRRETLGWDDVVMFITALFSVTYTVFCVVETRWGLGLPTKLRPKQNLDTFKVLSYAGKPWYQLALGGYKLALCIGYLRFIDGSNMRRYRWTIIVIGVTCALLQIVFVLVNFLNCTPIRKSFDSTVPGKCFPFLEAQYPMAIIGIVCDVVVFLLPIPLFTKLSLSKKVVTGLCILFGCGLITTACSITRTTYLKDVGPSGNGDNTWVVLWGTVEANVGIIMSSLPFLRALLAGMFKKGGTNFMGYRSKRSSYPSAGDTNRSYGMDTLNGKGNTFTVAKHRQSMSLSGSEEAILYEDGNFGGIMKTTQVSVRQEDRVEG